MKKSFTQQVREAAQTFEQFTAPDLLDPLGLRSYADLKRIRPVIRELRKTGEIKSVKRGVYVYAGTGKEGRKAEVLNRIYRAIHVSGIFSPQRIVMLTDADVSYVRSVLRKLVSSGDLRKRGRERNLYGQTETIFSVAHRDNFFLEYVK